jgi:hypothetical protein
MTPATTPGTPEKEGFILISSLQFYFFSISRQKHLLPMGR